MSEEQLRAELDAVYASTSWKITAPLRSLTVALANRNVRQAIQIVVGVLRSALQRKKDSIPVENVVKIDPLSVPARRLHRQLRAAMKQQQSH